MITAILTMALVALYIGYRKEKQKVELLENILTEQGKKLRNSRQELNTLKIDYFTSPEDIEELLSNAEKKY